ncbi:MFS transporter, partial [Klebsiella oxytoca]|uniref:MFS transporter n=1 Tax=Klebsiella oxytoca TaxID=571 RepID=UPI003871E1B2
AYCLKTQPATGETYPKSDLFNKAVSIATFALWGGNFFVSRFFPVLVENISAANTFFIFAGISVIAFIFVVAMVPETKGKTLEEIEAELHAK